MVERVWQAVESILDAALELPPEQRKALLEQASTDDPTLRRELYELLESCERSGGFLEDSAASFAAPLVAAAEDGETREPGAGLLVGPYRVLHELARGGMGTVYLAERADGQFEQRVALKLIKLGMDSEEVHRRFLAERRILARLSHSHIARLLDGGVTAAGQPYFAMEYVDGIPLTRFCNERSLSTPERLRLFEDVCEAVRYAHQNLVVHRDLKPSNILVTADSQVKLLDFGIAKLLAEDSTDSAATRTGLLALTPEYAAPEQVRGDPVTTATDVYALGAVLYELLAGRRVHAFERRTPTEIERVICELEPAAPNLGTDLDTIVLKALHKDPGRRYSSAEALQEDLQRYAAGLPVQARPDTAGYRFRKFLRRHRIGVAAGAAVALSLVAGLAVAAWQAKVARRQAARAGEVKEFLVGLFEGNHPQETRGQDVTARQLLDRGVDRLETSLASQPEIRAELFNVVSQLYQALGHYARADTLFGRTVQLSSAVYGPASPIVAEQLSHWADALVLQNQYARAESVLVAARDILERRAGPEQSRLAFALGQLANLRRLQANYQSGESLFRRSLALSRPVTPTDSFDLASNFRLFGLLLWESGNYPAADSAYQQALTLLRTSRAEDDPEVVRVLRNFALLRTSQGNLAEAERLGRQVLERRHRLFPNGHPDVATALLELASTLEGIGHWAEAESLDIRALQMRRQWLGVDRVETLDAQMRLAQIRQRMGKLDSAEAGARVVLRDWEGRLGAQHTLTLAARNTVGAILRDQGENAEAESLLRAALTGRRERLGREHPAVGGSLRDLGVLLYRTRRWEEAEQVLREALQLYRKALPGGHPNSAAALTDLGAVLTAMGRAAEAEPLLREALEIRSDKLQPLDVRLAATRRVLGECLASLRRPGEAEPLLLASHRALQESPYGTSERRETLRALVGFYQREGRAAESESYRRLMK